MKCARSLKFCSFRDILLWITGGTLFSISVNSFTLPGGFIQGGLTGISLMANHIFGTGVGSVMLLLNIPLFIWAYFVSGTKYTLATLCATAISSFLIDLGALILPQFTGDTLLSAMFSGLLCGAGLGLIYIGGATTGGSDLAGALLSKSSRGLSVGKLIFIIDAAICLMAIFVYKNLESGMYGVIMTYLSGRCMDAFLDGAGLSGGRVFFIITQKKNDVSRAISQRALRGVTILPSTGYYSGQSSNVILCAVRRHEISRMYGIIRQADKEAFTVVCKASDIDGVGFR